MTATEATGDAERFLRNFKKDRQRSFEEILRGKRAQPQIIAYRIEKLNLLEEVIQNFYLFNDQDTQTIEFLDSQISKARGISLQEAAAERQREKEKPHERVVKRFRAKMQNKGLFMCYAGWQAFIARIKWELSLIQI